MQRVLVCGGRTYNDRASLFDALDAAHEADPISCIIHGAARGADMLADQWAYVRGVPCERFPAKWDQHHKAAGPIRNQQMLVEGKPDAVIAFRGGDGTADMCIKAGNAGIPVTRIV
jgi:hypothetical protein